MRTTTKQKRIFFGTLLHAFLLLFLTIYWLSLPNIYSDEAFFIKWTSLIKKNIFSIDPKPSPDEVLFVDISDSKTTIPKPNEFDEISEYHQDVIVNRKHLAEFLALIEPIQEEVQHVFIDLLFEKKTPDDSLFFEQANRLRHKLLIATRLDKNGVYLPPVFDLEKALVTYQTSQSIFLKYNLYNQDSLKTGALVLLEKIDGATCEHSNGISYINGKLALNAPIVDFMVRPIDFKTSTSFDQKNFTIHKMGTIIESSEFMDSTDMADYFRNKLIVIGNYEKDTHQTVFGTIPGPLVLYNAYLTLKNGAYEMSIGWLIFLLLGFWFLSYVAFVGLKLEWPFFIIKPQQKWVEETMNESFILIIITILSYAIFNIHINILVLILYLSVITFLWKHLMKLIYKYQKTKL